METKACIDHIKTLLNKDYKSLLTEKAMLEATPEVKHLYAVEDAIKAKATEIKKAMLDVYRTEGIGSITGDVATAYVKDEHEVIADRLSDAEILALLCINPDALTITDKALRDTVDMARREHANGNLSEDVFTVLNIDLDSVRGPAVSKPVLRASKVAKD